ncbi:hypothetical protein [Carnimonas bestiolae]|uniref:hypothetical protein n=1 Tax=Carnimonas bestiolae TaxID=3402172 RepID=UPI003EDBC279
MWTLIWIVVFLVVAGFGYKSWDGSFGEQVKKYVPEPIKPDETTAATDRYLWPIVAGILVATLVIHPISTIITLVLIAVIAFLVKWLLGVVLSKLH